MDIKSIKTLINMFENSQLGEMEVDCQENGSQLRVSLKRSCAPQLALTTENVPVMQQPASQAPLKAETNNESDVMDYNKLIDVKSPMVGVFYAAPSPDSEPFVTKGTKVKKGDVLCIIEAMKLMNEVVAECDGEITEILPKSGELVEFGQVLFRIF